MIGDITLSVEHNYTTRAGMLSREHIPHLSFNPSEGQNQQLQWSLHNVKNMLSSYKVLPLNNSIDESNIQPELLQEKLIYAGQPGGGRAKRETSGLLPSREKTSDGRLQTTPAVTVARILTMGVDTNAPIVGINQPKNVHATKNRPEPAKHRQQHKARQGAKLKSAVVNPCPAIANKIKNIKRNNMDIDAPRFEGKTLIMKAATAGCIDEVTTLLVSGTNFSAQALNEDKGTALIYAAKNGHGAVVDTLLTFYEARRDYKGIKYADATGHSAIMYAAKRGLQPMFAALFAAGKHADVLSKYKPDNAKQSVPSLSVVNEEDRRLRKKKLDTPSAALAMRQRRIVKPSGATATLNPTTMKPLAGNPAQSGTSPDSVPIHGLKPGAIIQAANEDDIPLIDDLLAQGANIDEIDREGSTALLLSAKRGALQIVAALLERGANITITDQNNKSALHYAIEHRHAPVEELMLQYYAKNSAAPSLAGGTKVYGLSTLVATFARMFSNPANPYVPRDPGEY